MALTNLNKLFVRVTEASLRDAVITKSKETNNNKIYFLTKTQEIVTQGVAYGLSTDVQAQIANIKSILKSFYADGTENAVKKAIDAVQGALDAYKAANDAAVAANKADIESKAVKDVAYDTATKSIKFTTVDGITVQTIKASDIIGNHIVESSTYDADTNHLTLTFAGAEAPVDVDIDLGKMLDMNDVVSGDATHFTAEYADGKLTITPVITTVASDTNGLADAKDVKTYVDAAVSGAQDTLQAAIDTINGKLDVIQGEETVDGSIKKALKDAKDYTNTEVKKTNDNLTQEVTDRKTADQALYGGEIPTDGASTISGNAANIATLTQALADEVTARKKGDTDEQTAREAAIKEITDALANPATFWEDYTA